MNFYNPYFNAMTYTIPSFGTISNTGTSKGLLNGLFGGGKLSSFINGTQKTLSIINQAIPLVKQVSPVVKNAKTMFKVMNEFKRLDKPVSLKSDTESPHEETIVNKTDVPFDITSQISGSMNNIGPTFFL